jgi:hypothetical protein
MLILDSFCPNEFYKSWLKSSAFGSPQQLLVARSCQKPKQTAPLDPHVWTRLPSFNDQSHITTYTTAYYCETLALFGSSFFQLLSTISCCWCLNTQLFSIVLWESLYLNCRYPRSGVPLATAWGRGAHTTISSRVGNNTRLHHMDGSRVTMWPEKSDTLQDANSGSGPP